MITGMKMKAVVIVTPRHPTSSFCMADTVLLKGVVGSRAYGLDTPDSDEDILGCYIAPLEDLLSLGWNQGLVSLGWNQGLETVVTTKPDSTMHEVGKFVRLCLKCSPAAMELLWLPEYIEKHPWGSLLVEGRTAFLSHGAVFKSYGGSARQRISWIEKRHAKGGDVWSPEKVAKHARHAWRNLFQGMHLMEKGTLCIRLPDWAIKQCRVFGEAAAEGDMDEFMSQVHGIDAVFQRVAQTSVLPDEPDVALIDRTLLALRSFKNFAVE